MSHGEESQKEALRSTRKNFKLSNRQNKSVKSKITKGVQIKGEQPRKISKIVLILKIQFMTRPRPHKL